jgi:ribonuclease HI
MIDVDTRIIFTDAATSSKDTLSVGAFLCLHKEQIQQYAKCSSEDLFIKLADKVVYKKYNSKKSTWSEIKIAIDAIDSIAKNSGSLCNVEIYTDCQSLCDLLNKRKVKLESNNFMTRSGSVLKNADLYKELFLLSDQFQVKTFKIKGHASKTHRLSVHEKIFAILDKCSRKELRSILNRKVL